MTDSPRPIPVKPRIQRAPTRADVEREAPAMERKSSSHSANWVIGLLLFGFACQLALLVPQLATFRIVFRVAAFSGSLGLLILLRGRGRTHPAWRPALCALIILAAQLFHPMTDSVVGGFATIIMNLAIVAPILWSARLTITPRDFHRIILTLWAIQAMSSTVGVLQVYYPDRFATNLSSVVMSLGSSSEGLKFTLANGQEIYRPAGLTDTPGGAAGAASVSIILAMALMVEDKRLKVVVPASLGVLTGFFCLYICQVRSLLVMTVICIGVFLFILIRRGEFTRLTWVMTALGVAIASATIWAFSVGGNVVVDRFMSLLADDPRAVYYENRGHFLEYTVTVLVPQYPFGAGLGRWGMMSYYFSNPNGPDNSLWAEIQWTGWLYDGGVPLMIAYTAAIFATLKFTWRLAAPSAMKELSTYGALLFAYNVAALAILFNYPFFNGQGGLEFWILNSCLFTVWRQTRDATANARSETNATESAL